MANKNETTLKLGKSIDIEADDLQDKYLELLKLALYDRAGIKKAKKDTDRVDKIYVRAKNWLLETDFFTAPCSTRFHNSESRGLLIHTMKVYNAICELKKLSQFKDVNLGSAVLVALVHDWCKIGIYETYKKNIKDDITGRWEQEDAYRRLDSQYPFGHGETSMYIANKFFNTSFEESLAIRWHMGKWYVDQGIAGDLSNACKNYPIVNLLQFADSLGSANY